MDVQKLGQPGVFPQMILRIIEEFTDAILILNPAGDVVFFSEAFLRLTGWRSAEVLTRPSEILRALHDCPPDQGECTAELATASGDRSFRVASFTAASERGTYRVYRIKEALDTYAPHLHHLFHNAGDAIVSVDLKGRIQAANPSFYRLIGASRESAPSCLADLYLSRAELDDKIMRLMHESPRYNEESYIRTVDGHLRAVLDTSWLNRSDLGAVTGYTCQLRDITHLRNLQQRLAVSERNYILLFDSILSSIVIVDPHGRILNWNCGAEELYGYSWEEAVARDFDELLGRGEDRPPIAQLLKAATDNGGRLVETGVPRHRKDGSICHVYAAYAELRNSLDELLGYSIMERDLTESVRLERKLKESLRQLKETQSATILGFARLAEYRDKDTGRHLVRIRDYTRVLAAGLRADPRYAGYITDDYIEDLCLSAVLHDVGKVAVEDRILLKPGRLTPQEYARIKEHAALGGDALGAVDRELKRESFLTLGKEIAYYHHEWWDGSGYPFGRRGEEIPLSARLVALADVYDALTSERPYKRALSHEEAVAIIKRERGTHFDPDIVDVFLRHEDSFRRVKLFNDFEERPEHLQDLTGRGP